MSEQKINRALQSAPLPQMIERLGVAIANAQYAMDRNGILIATMMGDREEHGVQVGGEDAPKLSLLDLGFTPSFYQITEATIEAKVAFSMSESKEFSIGTSVSAGVNAGFFFAAVTVDASYSSKYSFEASGSSSISARFAAVPPPTILSDYLQAIRQTPTPDEEENP